MTELISFPEYALFVLEERLRERQGAGDRQDESPFV